MPRFPSVDEQLDLQQKGAAETLLNAPLLDRERASRQPKAFRLP